MSVRRRRVLPKITTERLATPAAAFKPPVFLVASSDHDDNSDGEFGMTGPTGSACSGYTAISSTTTTARRPKPTTPTKLKSPSKHYPSPHALLSTSSKFLIPSCRSISLPLFVSMQEQSPPPYTPQESSNDPHYYPFSPQANAASFSAASSRTHTPYPPPPPVPYTPSMPCCTNLCSHSQCLIRRRNVSGRSSRPTSTRSSPINSDSEVEDGAIYTSQLFRQRVLKENRREEPHDDSDSETSNVTIKRSLTMRHQWGWRHWFFALAAGVVGLGDGRDDERDERVICTTPGRDCAGETETETDEPTRHLPTARIISPFESSPLPPSTSHRLRQRVIPLLFEFSRWLSIVPALFGTLWNLYWLIWPHNGLDIAREYGGRNPPERTDFFVAALWSILTGYQCFAMTTGLFNRWQTYYPPVATLIRLLALQGICWPATQLTLTILDHMKRPVACWCVIGTTTSFSRSVQIWVTSNISVESSGEESVAGRKGTNSSSKSGTGHHHHHHHHHPRSGSDTSTPLSVLHRPTPSQRRPRFRWASTERRLDWKEVSLQCILPAGILYFIMAWVGEFRREWTRC